MRVGIPKEIKSFEYRVGMTPDGIAQVISRHKEAQFFVEHGAGEGSGFSDKNYEEAGAVLVSTAQDLYASSDLVVKVKEPQPSEYTYIRAEHTVFTYFHFASSLGLTKAMIESEATCIAYETVQKADGSLPLLTPMSEVAGRLSIQQGAKYLEKAFGGKGKLLGGIPGVMPAKVMIIGGGVVGTQAAKMAAGLGARVFIFELNPQRVRLLQDLLPANVVVLYASQGLITAHLQDADLVIGAVLIPGAQAPKVVTREMLKVMERGSVLVDVAIDQGGCFETSRPTSHVEPVYMEEGMLHYCVPNMPGAVPQTSTLGLTYNTLPYIEKIVMLGTEAALKADAELQRGLSIQNGNILDVQVAKFYNKYK
ncbi:MAG TPA: alanine dehydrogenase [Cytophagales bacterium]|nr:alanine dehydrogenase [Cytophagales bacterium]